MKPRNIRFVTSDDILVTIKFMDDGCLEFIIGSRNAVVLDQQEICKVAGSMVAHLGHHAPTASVEKDEYPIKVNRGLSIGEE